MDICVEQNWPIHILIQKECKHENDVIFKSRIDCFSLLCIISIRVWGSLSQLQLDSD